jgi:hypothetical protein
MPDNIIAQLTVTDNEDGTVRIVGSVMDDDRNVRGIDYDAPKVMLAAVVAAAEREGALT